MEQEKSTKHIVTNQEDTNNSGPDKEALIALMCRVMRDYFRKTDNPYVQKEKETFIRTLSTVVESEGTCKGCDCGDCPFRQPPLMEFLMGAKNVCNFLRRRYEIEEERKLLVELAEYAILRLKENL